MLKVLCDVIKCSSVNSRNVQRAIKETKMHTGKIMLVNNGKSMTFKIHFLLRIKSVKKIDIFIAC